MTAESTTAAADRLQAAVAKRNRQRQRRLLRKSYQLAMAICHDVTTRRPVSPTLDVSVRSSSRIKRLQRMERLAVQRGWFGAQKHVRQQLWLVLQDVVREAETAKASLFADSGTKRFTTPSDVIRDMAALATEFPEVDYDAGKHVLSVFTEDIELEDVFLGSFEIKLNFHYLGESLAYEVVAVDPHPAASSDDITHPHVSGDQLCEGDGHHAIRNALHSGRLLDFFMIVRQILETHNPHSAYVSLDDWHGITCDDCGGTVNESDASRCSRCDGCTCSECNCFCAGCDETYCGDCSETCNACGDQSCKRCLSCCDGCSETFCKDCLTDGECDACVNERTTEAETETENSPDDPVHAVCVGQTDLPA